MVFREFVRNKVIGCMIPTRNQLSLTSDGPANWNDLPVELCRKVIQNMDLMSRCRMRRCSHIFKSLIDSVHFYIPFVRISTEGYDESLEICDCPGKVLKVEFLWRRVKGKLRKIVVIKDINDSVTKQTEVIAPEDFSYRMLVDSLYGAVFCEKVIIGTLNIDFQTMPDREFRDFLRDLVQKMKRENRRPRKILGTGFAFLSSSLENVPELNEARFVTDIRADDRGYDDIRVFSGRHGISSGEEGYPIENWKASTLKCSLEKFIATILKNPSDENSLFWIPKFEGKTEEMLEISRKFNGTVEEMNNSEISRISIPFPVIYENLEELNTQKTILQVKISICGVSIEKFQTTSDKMITTDNTCGLKWMCSNCDKSAESWFFRNSINLENQKKLLDDWVDVQSIFYV